LNYPLKVVSAFHHKSFFFPEVYYSSVKIPPSLSLCVYDMVSMLEKIFTDMSFNKVQSYRFMQKEILFLTATPEEQNRGLGEWWLKGSSGNLVLRRGSFQWVPVRAAPSRARLQRGEPRHPPHTRFPLPAPRAEGRPHGHAGCSSPLIPSAKNETLHCEEHP